MRTLGLLSVCLCGVLQAQDPIGILEGQVADPSSAVVSGAQVTCAERSDRAAPNGSHVAARNLPFLEPAGGRLFIIRRRRQLCAFLGIADPNRCRPRGELSGAVGNRQQPQPRWTCRPRRPPSTPVRRWGTWFRSGKRRTFRLNGRDLMQLGLLQPGVAPMTAGLSEAGGILRSGQAFAVNGEPPESNNYLLDGVTNVDSVNGGFALRTPVDAVSEFRILSLNAPAEYGRDHGFDHPVVTKSGGNAFTAMSTIFCEKHAISTRATSSPGDRSRCTRTSLARRSAVRCGADKDFFFVYFEGQRDNQGESQAAIVPTAAERTGNFRACSTPARASPYPLINEFAGAPFPNKDPAAPCLARSGWRRARSIRCRTSAAIFFRPRRWRRTTTTRAGSGTIITSATTINSSRVCRGVAPTRSIRCRSTGRMSRDFP
jgi:hypothetical protein